MVPLLVDCEFLGLYAFFMTSLYWRTWIRTKLIMDTRWERARYMLRINPIFLGLWWMFWTIPLWIGYGMYRNNLGLVWERTLKKDDNKLLVRDRVAQGSLGYIEPKRLEYKPFRGDGECRAVRRLIVRQVSTPSSLSEAGFGNGPVHGLRLEGGVERKPAVEPRAGSVLPGVGIASEVVLGDP